MGSFTKTEQHDVKVFALCCLLSSYLIYNSLGAIDDAALESMSLVVQLARCVRDKPAAGTDGDAEGGSKSASISTLAAAAREKQDPVALRQHFPRFLWLLRDFALELTIEGRSVTEEEYLEHALKPLEVLISS